MIDHRCAYSKLRTNFDWMYLIIIYDLYEQYERTKKWIASHQYPYKKQWNWFISLCIKKKFEYFPRVLTKMEHFEQLLTCCVCLDRYRNPKLLPCQHSFCMEPCMEGLVDYVRRQVKCPECRAEHRIPYQGVQAFPTNVTLQRFLELRMEITGEPPDPTSGKNFGWKWK